MPIQTLMGLSDEPGRIGTDVLPASLVRHVAAHPDSTWHRLLTDPSRGGVELSTRTYRPTGPIWREVVALQPTCFAPTCERPATECELDHRIPYPKGMTSTDNLGPGCRRHHRSKHAPGASLRRGPDGVMRYTTRAGLTHLVTPEEVPVCDDPNAGVLWEQLFEGQWNCAELTDAVTAVQHHQRIVAAEVAEAEWRGQDPSRTWDRPPAEPELSALVS